MTSNSVFTLIILSVIVFIYKSSAYRIADAADSSVFWPEMQGIQLGGSRRGANRVIIAPADPLNESMCREKALNMLMITEQTWAWTFISVQWDSEKTVRDYGFDENSVLLILFCSMHKTLRWPTRCAVHNQCSEWDTTMHCTRPDLPFAVWQQNWTWYKPLRSSSSLIRCN